MNYKFFISSKLTPRQKRMNEIYTAYKKRCAYCGEWFYINCTLDEYCYKIGHQKYFCRYQHWIDYEKYGSLVEQEKNSRKGNNNNESI